MSEIFNIFSVFAGDKFSTWKSSTIIVKIFLKNLLTSHVSCRSKSVKKNIVEQFPRATAIFLFYSTPPVKRRKLGKSLKNKDKNLLSATFTISYQSLNLLFRRSVEEIVDRDSENLVNPFMRITN